MVREVVASTLMLPASLGVIFVKVIFLFSECCTGKQEPQNCILSHAVVGNILDRLVELSASTADWGGKRSPFSPTVLVEKSVLIPAPH